MDLINRWRASRRYVGDVVMVGFIAAQLLDGVLTYCGVRALGSSVEANPLIRVAIAASGVGAGIGTAKVFALALGFVLHLRHIHGAVALLTALYVVGAILPWAALFLGI